MLRYYGLRPDDFLVDIGCGSGRTAIALRVAHRGKYLGTDVVDELLDFARDACKRADWSFASVDEINIPLASGKADMVCCFSVFTHLLHEQTYLYLEEAFRVLKPGGKIVFSFLEFRMPFQWGVFEATVNDARGRGEHPLNVFIERDAIAQFAEHIGFQIEDFRDGDQPFVPLDSPVTMDDGRVVSGLANLGQSICVLAKS